MRITSEFDGIKSDADVLSQIMFAKKKAASDKKETSIDKVFVSGFWISEWDKGEHTKRRNHSHKLAVVQIRVLNPSSL